MEKIDNVEELCVGALVGLAFALILNWWVFAAICACAILWWLGGAEGFHKNWRRIGVPVCLCGLLTIASRSWIPMISLLPFWGVLTIGYGIPGAGDKGSPLGHFVWNLLGVQRQPEADIIARGIIGLLIGLSFFPMFFISGGGWFIGTCLLTIGIPAIVIGVD